MKFTDPSGNSVVFTLISLAVNYISQQLFSQPNSNISAEQQNRSSAIGAGVGALVNFIPGANGILKGILLGAGSGGISGGLSAGLDASFSGGDFGQAFWSGFKSGAITGGIIGGAKGYSTARAQGLNVWTGAERGYGRSQWALNNSNKYTWDVPNTPIMQTHYDCVLASYSRQMQMLEETYGYNDLINSLNYDVNTGYTGSIGDFTDYIGKGTGYSVRLEQITINEYSDKLMRSLSTQNIPIGHLEKMSQQYWHYSTVKSVTISNAGRVAIRVADPGGFTRRVYHGFYFQLIQNFFAY